MENDVPRCGSFSTTAATAWSIWGNTAVSGPIQHVAFPSTIERCPDRGRSGRFLSFGGGKARGHGEGFGVGAAARRPAVIDVRVDWRRSAPSMRLATLENF